MDRAAFLRGVELFAGLSDEGLARLSGQLRDAEFESGETILCRGEPGDSMFLIVEGEVRIPVSDPEGRLLFEAHLGPGQLFGEMALLTGEPRAADVVALERCRCLVFPRAAVDRLVTEHAEVAQLLTRILGERLLKSGILRQVGKYRILEELGRGAMAIVYSALHPGLERTVAMKMLSHELASRPLFRERFQTEARLIGRLRHPNIVEVYDTEEAYATFFIVMERVEGESLEELVTTHGPLEPPRVRSILLQLASALAEAHENGIVHRDLKPSNVVVEKGGEVKLMDFGLALDAREGGGGRGEGAGTPMYMAPEQISGDAVDARADVYALGLVAFQMLVGRPPFEGSLFQVLSDQQHTPVPAPRELRPEVPEDLDAFVRRATRKLPGERFQSSREILDFLGGPDREELSGVRVMTVSFLHTRRRARWVEEMIDELRRRVDDVEGVELR